MKGFIAEYWNAETHNINAVVKDGSILAKVLGENGYASIDLVTSDGGKYGLKFYKDAAATLKQQAKSARETFSEYKSHGGKQSFEEYMKERGITDPDAPIYADQTRIVPKEQLEGIRELLKRKIATEESIRPEQVERYQNTLKMLDDRIRDSEGVESVPLSTDDAKELARLAKENGVTEEELRKMGISTENLIGIEDILHQSFKAGMTAATISMVLKLAPEIYQSIQVLIQNGYLDAEDFQRMGFAALQGASEGFVRGTVAAALTSACQAGLCGAALKSLDPTFIGTAVAITMNTLKNACSVAQGKMTRSELANNLVRDLVVTGCSMAVGTATQIIVEVPVFGFMIGSFLGSVVGSFIYNSGYNAVLSFCVESGFTMFGLVEQDYELPEEVLREIGIKVFEYKKFNYKRFNYKRIEPKRISYKKIEPQGLSITLLRRGVIGVSQIGYIY